MACLFETLQKKNRITMSTQLTSHFSLEELLDVMHFIMQETDFDQLIWERIT